MISRRQFVWLAGSALASTLISACQRQAPTGSSDASAPGTESTGSPSRSAVQGTRSGAYDQAPALNAADYGALPPVDERLPRQPMVLGTPADVGAYGGVLRRPILQTTYGRTEPRLRGTVLRRPGEEATKVVDALNAHRFFLYDEHLTLRP